MAKPMTTKDFKDYVYSKENTEYEVLSDYVNAKTKVSMLHTKCNTTYEVTPDTFKGGRRCPKCAKEIRRVKRAKTTEKYIEEVYSLVKDEYTVTGKYVNWRTKMNFIHQLCNHEFKMEANSFLQGRRCPKCQRKKQIKSITRNNDDFLRDLEIKFGSEYTALETYVNNATPIAVKHNKCKHEWKVRPSNLLWGYGCPKCKQSKGENIINSLLLKYDLDFEPQKVFSDLKDELPLSYDFCVTSTTGNTFLIEYQGQQHFYPVEIFGGAKQFKKQQYHDFLKRAYAMDNGYILIEIPYTANTEDKVKSYLSSIIS